MFLHSASELRHDPIQKRWVIIAPERGGRPDNFTVRSEFIAQAHQERYKESCPFCIGNEAMTPPEILALRSSDERDWRIRVVPNAFPALRVEPDDLGRSAVGLYDRMNGIGAHEVVIETPEHNVGMTDLSQDHLADLFRVYRDQMTDLMGDERLRHVLIFKNHLSSAGASLVHSHSQIIATPIEPQTIATELESAQSHYRVKERCLVCDIIEQEVSCGDRIIYDDGVFLVFAPYASRFPFEMMIVPRNHSHQYGDVSDDDLLRLARCMHIVLNRLNRTLSDPPFNFVIHSAPNVNGAPINTDRWANLKYDFHWYIEMFPRLTSVAGFETGAGFYINPTPPEDVAEFLRKI
ncbi:MAG: galactose-1-phosphate uridylyltransferase [Candidatus Electryoneaceae bacterium]|nr:galactose-1-phosphate uridylyltransferase [Candidatus Electryoneaceae bacterium]